MWTSVWPLLLVVVSNTCYHIMAKSIPKNANPFLSLIVTYLVAAAVTFVIYLGTNGQHDILQEFKQLNWTSYLIGLAIIGLEAGNLFMYRAGWAISIGSLVTNISLAVILLLVGLLLYREHLSTYQIIGIVCCLGGLTIMNLN